MLCTSGFTDDVTFGCNEPCGASGIAIPGQSLMSMNALFYLHQHLLGDTSICCSHCITHGRYETE